MTGLPWQMLASIVMRSRRLITEFKIMNVGCQERGVNLCEGGFEVGILGSGGIFNGLDTFIFLGGSG